MIINKLYIYISHLSWYISRIFLVLVAFGPNRDQQQKRSSSNSGSSGSGVSRDIAASIAVTLTRLREPMVLTVVISLLARLRNVLRDESSLELHTQYLSLWPAGVPKCVHRIYFHFLYYSINSYKIYSQVKDSTILYLKS